MEIAMTPWDKVLQFLPYIIPLVVLQLILMIVALVDLIHREKPRYLPKWAWAIVIVFGELIGPAVYLLVGRAE
jgi:Phospholipase_D-nuclease N-terminal